MRDRHAIFRPMEDQDRPAVLALSRAWAEEDITYGYFANGENELEELYVVRACRGGGLGGALLGHVEETLRGEGVKRLMLTGANRDQGPLLRFYLRRGMTLYSFRAFRDL